MGPCTVIPINAVQTGQAIPNTVATLVSQAKNGDREAFAALYELHRKKVYSICLRMTEKTADAEDLTQEAFLEVFRKLTSFRGDSLFSTWLYRVTVNIVLTTLRKKRFQGISLDKPLPTGSPYERRELRHDDLSLRGAVDRIALCSAIRELSPRCRVIFLLHEVRGYDHQEIAKMLSCSAGNSKSQLHKARSKMRPLLFPHQKPISHEPRNVKLRAA